MKDREEVNQIENEIRSLNHEIWTTYVKERCAWLVLAASLGWALVGPRCDITVGELFSQESKPMPVAPAVKAAVNMPLPIMYPIRVIVCHDGDSLTCDVNLGYSVVLAAQHCRLAGYDSWEITKTRRTIGTITDAEIAKGKLAKAALEKLIKEADAVYLQSDPRMEREVYGRLWGKLIVKQRGVDGLLDVSSYMKSNNHDRNTK